MWHRGPAERKPCFLSRAKVFRRKGPPFRVTFVENSKLETNFNLTSFKHPKTSENILLFWVEFVLEFVCLFIYLFVCFVLFGRFLGHVCLETCVPKFFLHFFTRNTLFEQTFVLHRKTNLAATKVPCFVVCRYKPGCKTFVPMGQNYGFNTLVSFPANTRFSSGVDVVSLNSFLPP